MRHFFKKAIPIFIILFISGLVFFGYSYATKNLKSFISRFAEENFNAEISVGSVGLAFPVCLELKDVRINDAVDIPRVRIYPNPASILLKNSPIVSTVKIINPVVKIKKGERQFVISDFLKKKQRQTSSKIPALNFYFSKIRIQNGTLIYDDGKENILQFVRIKGNIESPGIYFSKGNAFHFAVAGFLKNKDSEFLSPLRMSGHIEPDNVIKAKLQASDIMLDTLSSTFANYLSGVIKEGRIDFESDVQISKSHLIAKCYVEGEDIVLKKGPNLKINTPIVASFIILFSFKSKMLKVKNLQGNFLELILGRSS